MRTSLPVGESRNHHTIRFPKVTPAAKSPAAASGGPRRRLTGLVEQLSCAVT